MLSVGDNVFMIIKRYEAAPKRIHKTYVPVKILAMRERTATVELPKGKPRSVYLYNLSVLNENGEYNKGRQK